jgi:hypothetical protein
MLVNRVHVLLCTECVIRKFCLDNTITCGSHIQYITIRVLDLQASYYSTKMLLELLESISISDFYGALYRQFRRK